MKRNNARAGAVVCAAVLTLSGCATTPSASTTLVKDVLADPDGYVAAMDTVPATTLARLPSNDTPVRFKRMELNYKVLEVRSDKNGFVTSRPNLALKRVLVPGSAAGTMRNYDVWSTNGIPYRYNIRISYRQLVWLKSQVVYTDRKYAERIDEIKPIQQFDAIAHGALAPARASYKLGSGDHSESIACTFGSTQHASAIHPDLVGESTAFDCDYFGANGQLTSHTSFAYLQSYGMLVILEDHDGSVRRSYKLDTLRVEGGPDAGSPSALAKTARVFGT